MNKRKQHFNLFKLACEACRRGYLHESILREIKTFIEQIHFHAKELKHTLSSVYHKVTFFTSRQNQKPVTSLQTDKVTKMPYSTFYKKDEVDEAYQQGEKFRKKSLF
ncbi:primase C-terminal domain-containing protein [Bacteroides faecichinchillae]|uniref:primase C-terminal domain-containing protein n=1 Tax=Bacteroides faecichinchillae TaxID=871325 RepID=UPI003516738E